MHLFIYILGFCFGQVPSLEHNNQVKGESLDLIKYIDEYFEGPKLFPDVKEDGIVIFQKFWYKFVLTC